MVETPTCTHSIYVNDLSPAGPREGRGLLLERFLRPYPPPPNCTMDAVVVVIIIGMLIRSRRNLL